MLRTAPLQLQLPFVALYKCYAFTFFYLCAHVFVLLSVVTDALPFVCSCAERAPAAQQRPGAPGPTGSGTPTQQQWARVSRMFRRGSGRDAHRSDGVGHPPGVHADPPGTRRTTGVAVASLWHGVCRQWYGTPNCAYIGLLGTWTTDRRYGCCRRIQIVCIFAVNFVSRLIHLCDVGSFFTMAIVSERCRKC